MIYLTIQITCGILRDGFIRGRVPLNAFIWMVNMLRRLKHGRPMRFKGTEFGNAFTHLYFFLLNVNML